MRSPEHLLCFEFQLLLVLQQRHELVTNTMLAGALPLHLASLAVCLISRRVGVSENIHMSAVEGLAVRLTE